MTNSNYFVAGASFYFFFDTKDPTDTQRAFDLAQETGLTVVVYAIPATPGPWDHVGLVGYRTRRKILRDLALTTSAEATLLLKGELARLQNSYLKAGRLTVPPQCAAA